MNMENFNPQAQLIGASWQEMALRCAGMRPEHMPLPLAHIHANVGPPLPMHANAGHHPALMNMTVLQAIPQTPQTMPRMMAMIPQQSPTWPQTPQALSFVQTPASEAPNKGKSRPGRMKKCAHGRRQACCKLCGGSQVCEHGKLKHQCRDCRGSGICPHNKRYATCKQCGGSQICAHGRRKEWCKECGGSGLCVHGKRRTRCKECPSSSSNNNSNTINVSNAIANVNTTPGSLSVCADAARTPLPERARTPCFTAVRASARTPRVDTPVNLAAKAYTPLAAKVHTPFPAAKVNSTPLSCLRTPAPAEAAAAAAAVAQICGHGRRRTQCRECGGSAFCPHGRRLAVCAVCGGSQICVHAKRKDLCKACRGGDCSHGQRRKRCRQCAAEEEEQRVQRVPEEEEEEQRGREEEAGGGGGEGGRGASALCFLSPVKRRMAIRAICDATP